MSPPSAHHSITFASTSKSRGLGFTFPCIQSPRLQLTSPTPGIVFTDFRGQRPKVLLNMSFYGLHRDQRELHTHFLNTVFSDVRMVRSFCLLPILLIQVCVLFGTMVHPIANLRAGLEDDSP